jgi:hypothetical protein
MSHLFLVVVKRLTGSAEGAALARARKRTKRVNAARRRFLFWEFGWRRRRGGGAMGSASPTPPDRSAPPRARFLSHVLPKGFHRIRHYGLFAKAACSDNIARARQLLGSQKSQDDTTDNNDGNETPTLSRPCPCCGGRMVIIEIFSRGSTPRSVRERCGI